MHLPQDMLRDRLITLLINGSPCQHQLQQRPCPHDRSYLGWLKPSLQNRKSPHRAYTAIIYPSSSQLLAFPVILQFCQPSNLS